MLYTEEMNAWLQDNVRLYEYEMLTELFNAKFGTSVNRKALSRKCYNDGLVRGVRTHKYTAAEESWLHEHFADHETYKDLAIAFSEAFDTDVNDSQIRHYCTRHFDLRKPHNTRVCAESKKRKIYAEKIGERGVVWIKISDDMQTGRGNNKNWVRKAKWVWENAHGKIPSGGILVHLDGDQENCDLENLYLVDRKINMMLNQSGWRRDDVEFNLTTIKWCELQCALKEVSV